MLADPAFRAEAVEEVAARGEAAGRVLMRWTDATPEGVEARELKVGLADAFGRLRYEPAIPFLMRYLDLERWRMTRLNKWMKTAAVVRETLPAADALIRIGPAALRPLADAVNTGLEPELRLIVVFVVSEMRTPAAAGWLRTMRALAEQEKRFAEAGMVKEGQEER
jgi:hypothetical protein